MGIPSSYSEGTDSFRRGCDAVKISDPSAGWEFRELFIVDIQESAGAYLTYKLRAGCMRPPGIWYNIYENYYTVPLSSYQPPERPPERHDKPMCEKGSIVEVNTLSLGEEIPLVGSDVFLTYRSDRVNSRNADYEIKIPLLGASPASNIVSVTVKIEVAGRIINQTLAAAPNLSYNFIWDGLDNNSNPVPGRVPAKVTISQTLSDSTMVDIPLIYNYQVGAYNVIPLGLGGWSFSKLHFYAASEKKVYFGDGSERTVTAKLYQGQYATTSEDGTEFYVFDLNGRHLLTKNALTGATLYTFNYDAAGRIQSLVDAYGNTLLVTRNTTGKPLSIKSPRGQITKLTLNSNNFLATVTNPKLEIFSLSYKGATGLLQTFQNPKGSVSTLTYDVNGYLTRNEKQNWFKDYSQSLVADRRNFVSVSPLVTPINYVSVIPYGQSTQSSSSSGAGVAISTQVNPGFNRSTQAYNGKLRFTETLVNDERLNGWHHRTSRWLENLGVVPNSTSVSTDINYSQSVNWGPGNGTDPFDYVSLTKSAAASLKTTTSIYQKATGVNSITSPEGRTSQIVTDANGKLLSSQVASFLPINFGYDPLGRLTTITQGSRVTTMAYNAAGFLASVTNPLLQKSTFAYDKSGRLVTRTLPGARVTKWTYDSNGNVQSVLPPTLHLHSFTSDYFDQVSSYSAPVIGADNSTTQYSYDFEKRLSQVIRPDLQVINFVYDNSTGFVSTLSSTQGTFYYTFLDGMLDSGLSLSGIKTKITRIANRIQSMRSTDTTIGNSSRGGYMTFFDGTNVMPYRLTVEGFLSTNTSQVDFGYDKDDLLTSASGQTLTRDPATGFLTGTSLGMVSDSYGYDSSFGELTNYSAQINPGGSPVVLLSEAITRDALGRVLTKSEVFEGTTSNYAYTYDVAGRLTKVLKNGQVFSKYVYDKNGNRTSGTQSGVVAAGVYDVQDRLVSYGTKQYLYNLNGELSQVTDGSAVVNYSFDTFGHLLGVQTPTLNMTYKLDGLGRRYSRSVNGVVTQYFIYDEDNRLIAELDPSGVIDKHFVYTSKGHAPDLMIKSGVSYRMITDNLGSIRFVVNSVTGQVMQKMQYDEFGKVLVDTNPGYQPFGYAGGIYDKDTALTLFGVRSYESTTGRWISKDPIGFGGGDTNLYGYVLNDPINFIDPTGLYWFRQDWQTPGEVGRVGSIVPPAPAGQISDFIERYVPAGYTFGQNHDGFVDWATSRGVPDWLANIPSMIPFYGYSVGQEALRSLGIISQPTPSNRQMCK